MQCSCAILPFVASLFLPDFFPLCPTNGRFSENTFRTHNWWFNFLYKVHPIHLNVLHPEVFDTHLSIISNECCIRLNIDAYYKYLSDTFLLLRIIQRDIIILRNLHVNYPLSCQILFKLKIFRHIFENSSNINFIKSVQWQPTYFSLTERVIERQT